MVTVEDKTPFIEVIDVSHTFADGVSAVSDISLTIRRGAFVCLVGTSGVGKSTLLKIMGGLLEPTSGQVLVRGDGANRNGEPIGIVFQRDNLMPWRTVVDNMRLPLELQGISKNEAMDRVEELITLVGLEGFEHSYPSQLSGGMAQRVALGRALIHRPLLLLLDEPFGALDALTRERMSEELLRIWRAMPVTVFMVTHSIPEAVLLADEVLIMTGRPGTITGQIAIDLSRPRLLEMQGTSEFQTYMNTVRDGIE